MFVNDATLDMVGALALHTKNKLKSQSNLYRQRQMALLSAPSPVMTQNGIGMHHYNHSVQEAASHSHSQSQVQEIQRENLVVGNLLGRGCFNDVFEVRLNGIQLRQNSYGGPQPQDDRFALKYLSPRIMSDLNLLRIGAVDLIRESILLSCLDHANIIKLYATPAGCVQKAFSSGVEGGYFLVLDHLDSTLDIILKQWLDNETSRGRDKSLKAQRTIIPRLHTLLSIAKALQYLHHHNIMYRDLKPENVGFNSQGVVKLFDFGLAKEIIPHLHPGLAFKHTSYTGALRFMAPEVAREMPYNLSADVYSFSIIMFQILALEVPFDKFRDRDTFIEQVVIHGKRPKAKRGWSKPLHNALKLCWSEDIRTRLTMTEILQILENERDEIIGDAKRAQQEVPQKKRFAMKFHH